MPTRTIERFTRTLSSSALGLLVYPFLEFFTLLSVFLANFTRGYANDHSSSSSLLSEFAPRLASLPSTNGAFATGDGVKLARHIGAALVGALCCNESHL